MSGESPTATLDARPFHNLTTVEALEIQADRNGDSVFAIYGPTDAQYTFAEMHSETNAIGNSLQDLGIGDLENVAFFGKHSLYTVLAMYGIHKARGVYSPINYEYEGDSLAYQLNDATPEYLILEDTYVERFNEVTDQLDVIPHVALVETDAANEDLDDAYEVTPFESLRIGDTTNPVRSATWDDPAVVLYTSGTTGDPKGVVCSHRVLLGNHSLLHGTLCNRDDTAHDPLPLYHIGGLSFCNSMLLCGGTIVLWDAFSSSAFWDRVDRYDATVTLILSVMIDWLTDKPRRETDQENPLKLVSLQPMPDNCVDIAERFSLEILISGYGQTETGSPIFGLINAGANHAGTPEGYRYGTGPAAMLDRAKEFGIPVVEEPLGDRWMGKPMEPNVKVTILDNRDKERPPGETGELAVRPNRPSVILDSYYNRPEQTLAAMDNFWFHTGDLVRCDEDGHFYFVDRMANVIRRRGENISPSRIQDTALEYGVVDAAVAFPVPAQAGGEDEIALVVASRGDDDVVGKAVREHLAAELPEFMVPAYVTLRVTLPTTSTNKVAVSTVREEFLADHPDFD